MDPSQFFKKEVERNVEKTVAKVVAASVGGIFFVVFFGFIFGLVIKLLWNALLPPLFDLPTITYWQAIGLFILAKIFFGFGGGGVKHSAEDEKEKKDKWKQWWSSKSSECAELTDDAMLKKYWEQEGKAAYEAFVKNRKASNDSNGGENNNLNP
jgi:hypothetical protein